MLQTSLKRPTPYTYIIILIVSAAAIWLRLWQLPLQFIADDEWHALHKLARSNAWGIFTSFGHADHSIPITLYYYAVSLVTPLTETIMRTPMVIAGLLTPPIVTILWGRFLTRKEQYLLFVLLALSPMLIYYTRTARPYAISTLLSVAGVAIFYLWSIRPSIKKASAYLFCCTFSAWLQPVTLTFLLTPFLFFGTKSLYIWIKESRPRLLGSLIYLGATQALFLALLLGPPIYYNLNDIKGKTGQDSPTVYSLIDTFKLFTGSDYNLYGFAIVSLIFVGIFELWRRNRNLTCYLLLCTGLPFAVIASSGAAWIQHALVTARYGLPILFFLALFLSIGIQKVASYAPKSLFPLFLCITALTSFLMGPLPRVYSSEINQFTSHMAYQADYNWNENIYNIELDTRPTSDFYRMLSQNPPQSINIVASPWFMEWHWNRWYIDQNIHQQKVTAGFLNGFCGSRFYGEYSSEDQRFKLRNIVHITDLLDEQSSASYDYLIYDKKMSRGDKDKKNYLQCGNQIRLKFGPPKFEDQHIAVYSLKAD